MSQYVKYYKERQEAYNTLATQFQNWADMEVLCSADRKVFSDFFTSIAKRFGLVREFRRRGLIH